MALAEVPTEAWALLTYMAAVPFALLGAYFLGKAAGRRQGRMGMRCPDHEKAVVRLRAKGLL